MSGRRARLSHQPALDGVRALAVAGVLAFHTELGLVPGGFLGVSAFFTLSGFLIASLLLLEAERAGGIAFLLFWIRRFRRLMPAAFLGVALAALQTVVVGEGEALRRLSGDGLASLFYFSNWHFYGSGQSYADLFIRPSAFQHFWSLSIEEQFYLLFPPGLSLLLATRLRRAGRLLVVGALALGSTWWMAWLSAPAGEVARVYYGTDTRMAELLVGVALAVVLRPGRGDPGMRRLGPPWLAQGLGWAGLAFIAFVWLRADDRAPWLYEGGLLLHSLATAALLFACVRPGRIASLFAAAPMRWLGRISYGVYVYHWPIFLWIDPADLAGGRASEVPIEIGLTLLAAWASYRFIEAPIRSGSRLRGRRGLTAVGAALAVLVGGLVRPPREPARLASVYEHSGEVLSAGSEDPDAFRILLVGDSLAVSLFLGMARWVADREGVRVLASSRHECAFAHGATRKLLNRTIEPSYDCASWVSGLAASVAEHEPDVVLAIVGFWEVQPARLPIWRSFREPGDPLFDRWMLAGLARVVDDLSSGGAAVLWLTAPCVDPELQGPASRVLGPGLSTALAHLNRRLLPALHELRPQQVRIVDLDARVCPGGRFQMQLGGVPAARPDGFHFTPEAAEWLADWLVEQAREAARAGRGPPGTH